MLFKNIRLYKLDLDDSAKALFQPAQAEELEHRISVERFKPASVQEVQSCGFTPVLGRNTEAYSFSNNNNHFFRLKEENKLLPKSIINEAMLDLIEEKEMELQRPLKKAEKASLRDALTNKLMAQAFSTHKELLIMINSQYGFALVGATSAKRADAALVLLSKALGGLHAKAFQPRCSVEERMTSYLQGADAPAGFVLGNDTVLKAENELGSTVRISKDDLFSEEVQAHLAAGKMVSELQFVFEDNLSLVLTSDIAAKRLALSDQFLEKAFPEQSDDAIADMQSMLVIEADILTHLTGALIKVFDCE